MIDKELLSILACPVCKGAVSREKDGLVCRRCKRQYPVHAGVPVMLIDDQEPKNSKVKSQKSKLHLKS